MHTFLDSSFERILKELSPNAAHRHFGRFPIVELYQNVCRLR